MAPHSYPLFERENHLFVELPEGPFLIDTGSPMSFGTVGRITLAGETYTLHQRAGAAGMSFSMSDISKLVTGPCIGLIGMDVLGKHSIRYSYRAGNLHVGESADFERGTVVASGNLMGVPMVGIHSRGANVRALFDTGAQYGYVLKRSLLDGLTSTGYISDYNPMLGDISGDSYSLPYQLIDENGEIIGPLMHETVGFLDAGMLGGLLGMLGAEAIIGWHLLENVDLLMRQDGGIELIP